MAQRVPSAAKLVALANRGQLSRMYRDGPDDEKIAVMACLVGQKETREAYAKEFGPGFEALRLLASVRSLDLRGARVVFTLAAACHHPFLWLLDLRRIARQLEREPAGTFHDDELRRLFRTIKPGYWSHRRIDGLDVTRRIEAALGIPETGRTAEPSISLTDDRQFDVWIDTWTQLIEATRASNGKIDGALRERSRQARRIVAAKAELAWNRYMLNLDQRSDQLNFGRLRRASLEVLAERPTFDRVWLAHVRKQEAAWHRLGPVSDWSTSAIPGIAALSKVSAGRGQSLVAFLRTLRAAMPDQTWRERAAALASGRHRPRDPSCAHRVARGARRIRQRRRPVRALA